MRNNRAQRTPASAARISQAPRPTAPEMHSCESLPPRPPQNSATPSAASSYADSAKTPATPDRASSTITRAFGNTVCIFRSALGVGKYEGDASSTCPAATALSPPGKPRPIPGNRPLRVLRKVIDFLLRRTEAPRMLHHIGVQLRRPGLLRTDDHRRRQMPNSLRRQPPRTRQRILHQIKRHRPSTIRRMPLQPPQRTFATIARPQRRQV